MESFLDGGLCGSRGELKLTFCFILQVEQQMGFNSGFKGLKSSVRSLQILVSDRVDIQIKFSHHTSCSLKMTLVFFYMIYTASVFDRES